MLTKNRLVEKVEASWDIEASVHLPHLSHLVSKGRIGREKVGWCPIIRKILLSYFHSFTARAVHIGAGLAVYLEDGKWDP